MVYHMIKMSSAARRTSVVHQGEILAMKKEVDALSSGTPNKWHLLASAWKLLEMLCEARLILSNTHVQWCNMFNMS